MEGYLTWERHETDDGLQVSLVLNDGEGTFSVMEAGYAVCEKDEDTKAFFDRLCDAWNAVFHVSDAYLRAAANVEGRKLAVMDGPDHRLWE